jgi:hypothetical protein
VKPPYNLGTQIRSALRAAWRQHPNLQLVLKRERIERPFIKKDGSISSKPRVFFKCYVCAGEFPRGSIAIDHIEPVGPTPGSKYDRIGLTWDSFIKRLFCDVSNLSTICETCHADKTKRERAKLSQEYHSAG